MRGRRPGPAEGPGPIQASKGGWRVQIARRFSHGDRPLASVWNTHGSGSLPHIQNEMNRLFDRFLGRQPATATGPDRQTWVPVVDMYETNDDLVLNFEIPGVREKE